MKLHQIIQDYFTFSRNERRGITILLILIFILAIANRVFFYFEKPGEIDVAFLDSMKYELDSYRKSIDSLPDELSLFEFNPNTIDSVELAGLNLSASVKRNFLKFRNRGGKFYSATDFRKIYGVTDSVYERILPYILLDKETERISAPEQVTILFKFNPNLASDSDFIKLGLLERQISTIRKYQSRGGVFRNKEDFLKIYTLTENQKRKLESYIIIDEVRIQSSVSGEENRVEQLELNTADSIQLKRLPGIGEKLSKRIIKYRDLIGGFNSVKQLLEVYGLKESVLQNLTGLIRIDTTKVRKLNLNFADENEISRHPYLTRIQASKIVKYRSKHGSYHRLSVLCDSMILNIDEFRRIRPYISEQK